MRGAYLTLGSAGLDGGFRFKPRFESGNEQFEAHAPVLYLVYVLHTKRKPQGMPQHDCVTLPGTRDVAGHLAQVRSAERRFAVDLDDAHYLFKATRRSVSRFSVAARRFCASGGHTCSGPHTCLRLLADPKRMARR